MLTETPKEPESRRDPENSQIMMQKTNSLKTQRKRPIVRLARTRRRAARTRAKEPKEPEDRRNPGESSEDDASDEPGVEKGGPLSLRPGFC
jgi:hypothetical protein